MALESTDVRSLSLPARLRTAILVAATGGTFYLCWLMVRPFLAVITWATALAILTYPAMTRLEQRMSPKAAAFISICLVAIVIITPLMFLTQALFAEVSGIMASFAAGPNSWDVFAKLQQYPTVASVLEWVQKKLDLDEQIHAAAGAVTRGISSWVGGSVWMLTQLVLTFLTLFYFLRDRTSLLKFFRQFVPLSAIETDKMFDRIAQTVTASVYKNLLVKLIQGILGGLMFWILGLPSPVLCGAAMALLAIFPILGTGFVWAPAVIFLVYTGSWVKAVVLFIWGSLVVGLIDNFLYPLLVAGELRFHPLAVFFAVFGGLLTFGVAGVVLGPVILAITVALLELWRFKNIDDAGGA